MERFDKGYDYGYETSHDRGTVIRPVGVDRGDLLANLDAEALVQEHLKIQKAETKWFVKDGYILLRLWVTGEFRQMYRDRDGNKYQEEPYPYTREGFYTFLHDHGSQISPDEGSRRIKVFRAYNRFNDVTVIRLVEQAGVNKAFAAIPHIPDAPDKVADMLRACIKTPYPKLRKELLGAGFPRKDGGPRRGRKSDAELRQKNEERAKETIAQSDTGMIGDPSIFIPRQFRQLAEEEFRARMVYVRAMRHHGFNEVNDRDKFFVRVVDLIAEHMLTPEDRQAIEHDIVSYKTGEAARSTGLAA